MASLANTIKSSSGLASASMEELAAQSGRAAPIQPMESKLLGGSPDQAKMAGTPNQKANAIRSTIQGGEDLATRVRRGQTRTQASEGEGKQLDAAGRLQNLGDLNDRVDLMAQSALDARALEMGEVELQAEGANEEQNALLEKIKQDPNDWESIKKLNTMLGYTTTDSMMSGAELMAMYGGEDAQIAAAFGATLGEAVAAGNLDFKDMGFDSVEEVAGLLGTDVTTLQGLSIPQLLAQIDTAIQQEHTTIADLEARANDPRLGAAERAEARKSLREAGAVGIRAAETDVDRLADDIAEAGTVEFMGQEMTVEELLSSEHLSSVMAGYLDGLDPDTGLPITDYSKKIMASNPGFAKFVSNHKDVLKVAAEAIDQGGQDFIEMQTANQMIGQSESGESLSDEFMGQLYDDWGQIRDEPYPTDGYPFIELLNGTSSDGSPPITGEQTNSLVKFANEIYTQFPGYASQFAELTREELADIGALGDTEAYARFHAKLAEMKKLDQMETPDDMAKMLGARNAADLDNMKREIGRLVNAGVMDDSVLDSIPGLRDGNWAEMGAHLKGLKPTDLKGIIKNMDVIGDAIAEVRDASKTELKMPGQLAKSFYDDTVISAADVFRYGKNLGWEDWGTFIEENEDKFHPAGLEKAQEAYNEKLTNTIKDEVNDSLGIDANAFFKKVKTTQYADQAAADADNAKIDELINLIAGYANKPGAKEHVDKWIDKLTQSKITVATKKQQVVDTDTQGEIDDINADVKTQNGGGEAGLPEQKGWAYPDGQGGITYSPDPPVTAVGSIELGFPDYGGTIDDAPKPPAPPPPPPSDLEDAIRGNPYDNKFNRYGGGYYR